MKLLHKFKNLFKKPPEKETAKPRITEKEILKQARKNITLTNKEKLTAYLYSKGYTNQSQYKRHAQKVSKTG